MKYLGFLLPLLALSFSSAHAEVAGGNVTVDTAPKIERGIAGVKIVSDTGAYAITDEDGKYHFPFLPVGQRVLKIDASTLPKIPGVKREGFIPLEITTESPRKVVITPGVMTKVSFGVRPEPGHELPNEEIEIPVGSSKDGPLLKASVTQDGYKLSPHLSIVGHRGEDKLSFVIETNYHLFVERAELKLYDAGQKHLETVELPQPLPRNFETEDRPKAAFYQLSVFDKKEKEDRTSVGKLE